MTYDDTVLTLLDSLIWKIQQHNHNLIIFAIHTLCRISSSFSYCCCLVDFVLCLPLDAARILPSSCLHHSLIIVFDFALLHF